jgi:hypothetical protein
LKIEQVCHNILTFFSAPLHNNYFFSAVQHSPPESYPSDFVHCRKSGQLVRRVIAEKYLDPLVNPLEEHTRLFIPVLNLQSLDPMHPPYFMLRFDKILSPPNQRRIFQAWVVLLAAHPQHHIAREASRSKTPGLHVGIWELSSATPFVTRETKRQTPEAMAALDQLLSLVKLLMVPKILSLTCHYLPNQFERYQRSIFLY